MNKFPSVTVNGRVYQSPRQATVVICMDGSGPAYTEAAMAQGAMPYLREALPQGFQTLADCVIPSFTNPNNLSIMTGRPPEVHGISGNYFIDPQSGEAVMMNDPAYLRAETIFAAFSRIGLPVAIITAKDKLRRLLGHGMEGGLCFSAEKADQATLAENGITKLLEIMGEPLPSVYSADLTTFTLRAGVKLLSGKFPGVPPPQLLYLSTTDYIQHKFAPGTAEANALYRDLDDALRAFDRLGACWVLTADHGMSAKSRDDGTPRVLYVQSLLDDVIGQGNARVILPITDPYVVHHGALGSYASIYVRDPDQARNIVSLLRELPGMEWVGLKAEACRAFHLPADRIGEVIAISDSGTALGTRREDHDLSCLTVPLRSHGGLGEREIPLFSNRGLRGTPDFFPPMNYDAFFLALNLLRTNI